MFFYGFSALFLIQTNGTIRAKQDLETAARVQPYELRVRAQDGGIPTLSSEVTVTVRVQDGRTLGLNPVISFPPEDGMNITIEEVNVYTFLSSLDDFNCIYLYDCVYN